MRWPILLSLVTAPPLFCASQVYAPLATSLITTFNSKGQQSIVGAAAQNAKTFFLGPDDKTFFVTALPGTLEAVNPLTGKSLLYKTTYPVFTNYTSATPFALSPDGSKLLVGTCASAYENVCQEGFVEIFATASAKQLAAISFAGDEVTGIAVAPDGQTAYVTHQLQFVCSGCFSLQHSSAIPSNSISAVSMATFTAANSLPLSEAPGKVVWNPAGTVAYVAPASDGGELLVVSLPQLNLADQIQLPDGAQIARIALTANGALLCASMSSLIGVNTLTCYQTSSLSTIGSVTLPPSSEVGLAIDSAGKFAYVGNAGTGLTYQVSISTLSISASFPSGDPLDLALSSSGRFYCLSGAGASVAVFGETSSIPSHVISAPLGSQFLISPNGLGMYLAARSGGPAPNTGSGVTLVSLLSGATLATYLGNYSITSIAISLDGTTLFAGGSIVSSYPDYNYYFFEVDTASGKIKNQIPSTSGTPTVTISPNGKIVIIGNLNGQIGVYNIAQGAITATIPFNGNGAVANNSTGTVAYVGGFSNPASISVVDLTNYTVTGSINIPCDSIVFSPTAPVAYAWNLSDYQGTLSVIDTQTNTVTSTMPLQAGSVQGLAISPDGKYLYTSGALGEHVGTYYPGSIIDTATLAVIGLTPTFSPLVVH